jgi:hypothetical protein
MAFEQRFKQEDLDQKLMAELERLAGQKSAGRSVAKSRRPER